MYNVIMLINKCFLPLNFDNGKIFDITYAEVIIDGSEKTLFTFM